MSAAKIVLRDVQRDRSNVIIKLLAKAVRQPREPAVAHADRKVLPFDIAGGNILLGIASYYFAAYGYYGSWAVSGRGGGRLLELMRLKKANSAERHARLHQFLSAIGVKALRTISVNC